MPSGGAGMTVPAIRFTKVSYNFQVSNILIDLDDRFINHWLNIIVRHHRQAASVMYHKNAFIVNCFLRFAPMVEK